MLSAFFHYAFIASLVSITMSVCYYMNAFRKIGDSYDIFAVCVTWSKFTVANNIINAYFMCLLVLPVFVVIFCVAPGYQFYTNQIL